MTAIRGSQEALWESEEQFRQLAEHIQEVFWMANLDPYRVIYVNPIYEKVWGRLCESLYEEPTCWLDAIHPEDRERVAAAFERRATGEYDEEFRN